jgi:hypothetical protein
VVANQTYAADALRAIEAAVDAIDAWNTKLEKHTKHEDACAVVTTQTYDLARGRPGGGHVDLVARERRREI